MPGPAYVFDGSQPRQRLRQRERAVDQMPGWFVLGSATLSVASPAVEITVAVVDAV